VLSPLVYVLPGDDPATPTGFVEKQVTIHAGMTESPFVLGGGMRDVTVRVRFNPAHGGWIRDLIARGVEVVWATTWEEAANACYGPLLGVPRLPLGVQYVADCASGAWMAERWGATSDEWKAAALRWRFADRPLVWIDDTSAAWAEGRDWRDGAPTLVITPRDDIGLTTEHMRQVDAWLATVTGAPAQGSTCSPSGPTGQP
jgi:hypothetical protein